MAISLKESHRVVLFVLVSLVFVAVHGLALAATPIGRVAAVSGNASASGPGGDRKLSAGAAVFEDDKITVSGGGNAQIVLRDETKLVVGPGSTLVLDRFVLRGSSTARRVSVTALRGTFRFITGKSPKQAYEITSSSATIGIRGTGFDFWVSGQTGVAVMRGQVRLCNRSGNNRGCVELQDDCNVGVANRGDASELNSRQNTGRTIKNRLPYIVNQRPLRREFHLPTGKCDRYLAAVPVSNNRQSNPANNPEASDEPDPPDGRDPPDVPQNPD